MYTKIDNVYINYNFNDGIKVSVNGPEAYYCVEVREYLKGSDESLFVESFHIGGSRKDFRDLFKLDIEFYGDFEISVYRFDLDEGLQKIFTHRYDDRGKLVRFNIDTDNFDEAVLWANRIRQYAKTHGCKPLVFSKFPSINKSFQQYFFSDNLTTYKTYRIGRYPKTSTDFRTTDQRKEGLIWYGNWKTFWSYQHPRPHSLLSSQEIVDDILGI